MSEARRLKDLESENSKLKRLLADSGLAQNGYGVGSPGGYSLDAAM